MEAESKGLVVSHQKNHYIKELLTWMRFIVGFVTLVHTLSPYGTF